jgi:hypothetical protein
MTMPVIDHAVERGRSRCFGSLLPKRPEQPNPLPSNLPPMTITTYTLDDFTQF